jgi:hypothetical protein
MVCNLLLTLAAVATGSYGGFGACGGIGASGGIRASSTGGAAPEAQDPAPAADLAEAFQRASAEGRRLVLGVYTAGEARSEDFAKRVLRDKAVRASWANVVPVQVLLGEPTKAEARRFGGHEPDIHRALERAVRDHLPANAEGVLASPQHVWFAPDGRLLLAAPYELDPEEYLWLDWRSQRLTGAVDVPLPEGARAPRRYLEGVAFAPIDGDRFGRGLLPPEVAAELEVLRKRSMGGGGAGGGPGGGGPGGGGAGGGGGTRMLETVESIVRLAFTDSPDAQDEVRNELGNMFLRLGGGSNPWLEGGLEIVAYAAPRRGAEFLVTFLGDPVPGLRARGAAALESLGYEGIGWTELRKALDKEEDAVVRRALLRAAGVAGRREAQARRLLEKEALKGKAPADRCAALIGLGHIGAGAELEGTLRTALGDPDLNVALAAAAAMAMTRDSARFKPLITERAGGATEDTAAFETLLAVLDGAPFVRLRDVLQRVAPDDFPRTRLFFEARPPVSARGGPGAGPGRAPGGQRAGEGDGPGDDGGRDRTVGGL